MNKSLKIKGWNAMLSSRCITAVVFIAAFSGVQASAELVTYAGEDIMTTTSSPNPNSAAAAASFDTAVAGLGPASLITFESATLGSFSNLAVAPGVTLNGSDVSSADQTIRNSTNFPTGPTLDGYNTTPGGAEFLEMQGGTATFTFATPIQAFGAYFSGIQSAVFFADSVTFSDGTSQTVLIPGAGTSGSTGGLSFVGFTDAGESISSVTIHAGIPGNPGAGFDDIGVDDVRFQATTPEPGSMALLFTGCCFFVAVGYRQRRLRRA